MEQDDLELISIGALYRGQFEKKYWSSSRGKDRYPYPIGYHASRIIFGQKCKMQISEGPRGPLFVVGSDDGDLCIGLTPDLAWENFNKKNSPKIQNGQGKRLSSKIDGAELFGLKNKIVKRLLRQLITASSGSPKEQIYSSSEEQISKSSKIIPIEILQQISCNINNNNNSNNNNSNSNNNNNNNSSNNNNNNSNNDNDYNNVHPYKIICYKRKRSINKQKIEEKKAKKDMVSDSQKENRGHEESAFGAEKNELVMKTSDNEIVLEREKHVISQENCAILQNSPFQAETLLEIPKKEDFSKTVPNSPEDTQNEAMKDIFITNELVKDISIINEEIEKESTIQNISIINEAAEKDNIIENLSIINEEVERENTKENISIINEVERENTIENFSIINEVVERESNREDISIIEKERTIEDINIINEIVRDSQTSNFSSQKTDENSEKQELTRSMMEFLLPQAVPLLKQKYTRKRFKNKHIQNDSFKDGEMKSEAMSQQLKEETIISEVVKNNLVTKEGANLQNDHGEEGISVIADSFEDNSNQKFESSILSPVTRQGADLQNGHEEGTYVIADSFEDNLNQKIESSILNSVIKQGTDLQNGLGEDTCVIADSFEDNLDNKLNSSMSSPVKKEGANFQNELREVTCVIADSIEDNSNNNINSSILTPVTKQGANLQNDHEEGTHVIADSFEDNSNQKIDSSISSPVKKEGTNLQNDHEEGTHVIADSFEDNSNQKIDSSISNPVTKQGANLQNDHEAGTLIIADSFEDKNQQIDPPIPISTKEGTNLQNDHADVLTDSFLAGLEDKFCLIENEAIKNKTNIDNQINTSEILIKSKNSEIPKLNPNPNSSNTNEFTNSPLDRFGPYEHQEPVLSIKLNSKDNNCLEIFVLCGELNSYKRFIYIYNLVLGQPSFVGYTSILINSDPFNENLEYISEGRLLAIIPSIKIPYCRKMCINCSCSICKLEQDEENFLKLVRVDFGYVVPVIKLKINEKISSVLFCKPNYIIAVEKTRLHVWIMSPNFREISDEFELSTLDNIILSIFELHQVQGSNNSLVFGHNGFHDFLLWDISKRVLIAKFQAPNSNISKIIPLNCFNINKSEFSNINHIKLGLKNNPMQLGDNNYMVVYLLVKSSILPECENDLNAKNNQNWKLAILANNALFLGHFLDARISVIDGCNKFVLAGTNDGFCYKLDLNTGTNIASMDCFSSGSISNIAFDPKSGAVAVANNQNELLIYTQQN